MLGRRIHHELIQAAYSATMLCAISKRICTFRKQLYKLGIVLLRPQPRRECLEVLLRLRIERNERHSDTPDCNGMLQSAVWVLRRRQTLSMY